MIERHKVVLVALVGRADSPLTLLLTALEVRNVLTVFHLASLVLIVIVDFPIEVANLDISDTIFEQ